MSTNERPWAKRLLTPLVTVALLASVLQMAGTGRAHTGAWIDSSYVAAAPTIDGALAPGEWANATVVNLTSIPGNRLPAYLFVENNATSLFVAYDAVGDATRDAQDMAAVSFDTDHDGVASGSEDQFWWGAGASNGQAHLRFDGIGWSIEDSPFNTGLPNHAGLAAAYAFGPSDLGAASHEMYELSIPLALLGVAPGEIIGLLGASLPSPGVLDMSSLTYDTWPDFLLGPPPLDQYGDLRIGQPAQPNALDLNPPSQSQRAAPGATAQYTVTAVNRGTSNDTYEITASSNWNATLFDATGTTPLPDTDNDTIPDTGPVAPGAHADFVVKIDVPPGLGCDNATITGTSANDPGVSSTALLHTCVPDAFLSPPHSDAGIDTDVPPDGLFNVLRINVGVTVLTAGFYSVQITLFNGTQTSVITSGGAGGPFALGYTQVPVDLSGGDISRSGVDGPYVADIQLLGNALFPLDRATYTTAAYTAAEFNPPDALFSPPHSDGGVDTDGNGLFDFLVVNASVRVNRPGTFMLDGLLLNSLGGFITQTFTTQALGLGAGTIPLQFVGRDIYTSGFDGPYDVLMILSGMSGTLDVTRYTTRPYTVGQFEPPPAAFSPPHSDHGVDLSVPPDGLFEFLEIDASVQVAKAGTYSVHVSLYDGTGSSPITSATGTATLAAGPQQVPVRLDGLAIAQSGFSGPYVADLTLSDAYGNLGSDIYLTGAYAPTDFAPPGARLSPPYGSRLVDTDGDGLADWLAIDIGVDVTIAGNYSVSGALIDQAGQIIGSAPVIGPLTTGPHIVTLLFDGHTIASLGATGPFIAQFRLFDGWGRLLGQDFFVTEPYTPSQFEPVDTVPPTATAFAVPYWANRMPLSIPWIASDAAPTDGLASVSLLYRYSTDNTTWSAWTTWATLVESGMSANGTFPFTFDDGIGFYEFQVIAEDKAGNTDPVGAAEARAMFRPLASLSMTPATLNVPAGQQRTLQVQVLGPDGQRATLASPLTVSLRAQSSTGEFRAVGTGNRIVSITIPAGQSSGSVDYFDTTAGTWGLLASSGPTTDAQGQAIVAPAAGASMTISPSSAPLMVGGTLGFSAEVRDAYGNLLPSPALTWSADTAIGTIDTFGMLTAATQVASGNVTVTLASNPNVRASAAVTLVPGPATSVSVVPASVTLVVGAVASFDAIVRDAYGNAVTESVTWSADAGLGTIDTASGVLTAATAVASGLVTAAVESNPSVQGSASVTLVPGAAAQVLIVAPTTVTLPVGASHTFTATVEDQYGNGIPGAPIAWSVTGGAGTIDGAGLFTAGHQAAPGQVVATSGTAQAVASVTVTPGTAAVVWINPPAAAVAAGSSLPFTAFVTDAFGNVIAGAPVTWSADPAAGTISASGVLTVATKVGTGIVNATSGTAVGQAGIAIIPAAPSRVVLAPLAATVQYGQPVDLRAYVTDQYGNVVTNATVTWTVSGPGTLGATSGATTTMNGTEAGTVTVTAHSGTLSADATFRVLGPVVVPQPEPSNAPIIGAGALIAGLLAGIGVGWAVGRRGRKPATPAEDEEEEEEGEGEGGEPEEEPTEASKEEDL